MTTTTPVEYPTQEDLDRLALLEKFEEAERMRIPKVRQLAMKYVALPALLLLGTMIIVGFLSFGIKGVVLAFFSTIITLAAMCFLAPLALMLYVVGGPILKVRIK
jgi:hypothetical protein